MLQVREDLCVGCGLCGQNCSQQAISILWGWAEIDQERCNSCRLCLEVCPLGAIIDIVPVSWNELQLTVVTLKGKADDLIERIDRLRA